MENVSEQSELNLSWEEAENGVLVFYPHLTGGRPNLIHKNSIDLHSKRVDEQTAGNVSAKYVPYLDAVNAPEILKENEQLKRFESLYNKSRVEYKDIQQANYKLIDINAELLLSLQKCEYALKEMVDDAGNYKGVKYTASTFSLVNAALVSSRESIEKVKQLITHNK